MCCFMSEQLTPNWFNTFAIVRQRPRFFTLLQILLFIINLLIGSSLLVEVRQELIIYNVLQPFLKSIQTFLVTLSL